VVLPITLILPLLLAPERAFSTPPKSNAAELARWNAGPKVGKNNCYNYATNQQNDKYAQPGWTDPLQRQACTPDAGSTEAQYCTKITNRAIKAGEGLTIVAGSATPGDPEPADSNLVALVVSLTKGGTGDYHWYRRDGNGNWSHKPGGGDARTYYGKGTEAAGPKVTDPRDPNQIKPDGYQKFCGYFKVTKPAGDLRGLLACCPAPDNGIRVVSLTYGGLPDPFHDLVGTTASGIISRLPTQSPSNQVPDPHWTAPTGQDAYDLIPGTAFAGSMPQLVRVCEKKVAFYNADGVPPVFYRDDHGLQAYIATSGAVVPGVSVWGLAVLALMMVTGGVLFVRNRLAGRA
jgi:hypothetical protein